jgi:AraC-like DNA-binding protein
METDPTMRVIDAALRGGAATLLLLIAGLLVRDHGRAAAARLGAGFAIGVAAYTICSAPGFADGTELWHVPILALCSGNAVVFWLFSRALFDDDFGLRRWHAAVWITLVGCGLLRLFVLAPARSPLSEPVGIALTLVSAGFAALAVGQSVAGWRMDLVEGRRRLRPLVVGGVAGYIAIIAVAELMLQGSPAPRPASALNAAGLVAVSALIAWSLLRVSGNELFLEPAVSSVAPAIGRSTNEKQDRQDTKLIAALDQLMTAERIYRQEGLTIGMLATKMSLPEYRLRRLINQALGHRNFNAFVNRYRIEDAKSALADPEQAEVPILTIALDAGFRSLGPFNRAFKAETCMTPTDYRIYIMLWTAPPPALACHRTGRSRAGAAMP